MQSLCLSFWIWDMEALLQKKPRTTTLKKFVAHALIFSSTGSFVNTQTTTLDLALAMRKEKQ